MGTRRKRGPFGPGLGDRVQAVTISNLILWCALVLLGSSCLADLAACPRQCHCPKYQPCPPGVRLVLDDCRCCQVCARRFNEDCDALRPCDRARGLRCQLEATPNATHGICRASTPGRPCVMDGKVYQHGEVFKQTCRLQCTCKDGKAACYPLCPSRLAVLPASCADARLVKLPGTCCKKWKCASSYSKDKALRMRKWKEALVSASQVARQRKAVRKMRGQFKHQSSSDSGCRVKNTEWSMCSRTCDMGISVRQSNNNTWCQLKQEIRLCQLRRCDMLNDVHLTEGKTCLKSDKEKEPRPFVFAGCTSLRRYTPKYCGFCTDGRCCQPSETRTTKVRFRCWGVKETFVKDVMKIKRCECNRRCQQDSGHHRPGDAASDGSTDRKSTQETHRNF